MGRGAFVYLVLGPKGKRIKSYIYLESISEAMNKDQRREQEQLIAAIACMFFVVFLVGWLSKPRPVTNEPDIIKDTHMISYSKHKHSEITYINDVYDRELDSMGVDSVTDSDWEETAHALGVDLDDLTILMFMDHMRGQ